MKELLVGATIFCRNGWKQFHPAAWCCCPVRELLPRMPVRQGERAPQTMNRSVHKVLWSYSWMTGTMNFWLLYSEKYFFTGLGQKIGTLCDERSSSRHGQPKRKQVLLAFQEKICHASDSVKERRDSEWTPRVGCWLWAILCDSTRNWTKWRRKREGKKKKMLLSPSTFVDVPVWYHTISL